MRLRVTKESFIGTIIFILFDLSAVYMVYLTNGIDRRTLSILTILNVIQSALILVYCIRKLKKRFTLFSFNVAYFILLQGAYAMNIGNDRFYGRYIFATISNISYTNEAKGLMFILLSQSIAFIFYTITKKEYRYSIAVQGKPEDYSSLRNWSQTFLLLGAMAAFTKVVLKIAFVASVGYLGTYLSNGSAMYENAIIDLFDKFYYLGFYGYLATFPDIKSAKRHIAIFLFYSFLTLLTGIRGELVVNVLFVVWYLSRRDAIKIDEKEVLNKKRLFALGIIAIISFSFLYEFNYTRFGQHSTENGLLNKVFSFIRVQGGSGRLVALSLEYREDMLKYISPLLMLVYPIRNFIINNSLVRIFTGGVMGQSLSALELAPSFGTVLTYVTNPRSYLNGSGLGTSYVAEVANSYGMITVIFFSALIGIVLTKTDEVRLSNWTRNVLWMNAFTVITYIPRHSLLQIFPDSAAAVLFVIILRFLSKQKKITLRK